MKLLPCPYCGKTETLELVTGAEFMDENQEYYEHSDSFTVVCNCATQIGKGGCGATGGFGLTIDEAVGKWNKRNAPSVECEPQVAELEATIRAMTETAKESSARAIADHNQITGLEASVNRLTDANIGLVKDVHKLISDKAKLIEALETAKMRFMYLSDFDDTERNGVIPSVGHDEIETLLAEMKGE